MPNLQTQAAWFRTLNYHWTGFLGTIPQTVIYTAFVNMPAITYPVKAITFDGGVGTFANVKDGMEVLVYHQNTSTLKGRLRAILDGSSVGLLQVNEFSQGYLDLADNDRIEVVEDWRIHDKLIEASKNFRKDSRITYTDQGANPNPVANGGGPRFGFIDPGANYRTIAFDFATSFRVDPDSGSLSYSANIKDGTLVSGSLTSSAFSAQFAPGFRHVELTVTDSAAGKTAVKEIPVRVFDAQANAPLLVQMESRTYNPDQGWSATFKLPIWAQASITALPDGAFICYFEREYYGTSEVSYGSNVSGQSHIKFVGYLVRESIDIDPENSEVTFEAVSPLAILEQTPALPQIAMSKASPANWQQVKSLTVNRALWYLWHWHSNADVFLDFLWVDGTDLAYKSLTVENVASLAGQLRDIASAINVKLTCDRLGRLLFIRDPNYLEESDRAARTTTYSLTTADIMRLSLRREHRGRVKSVEGRAFDSNGKPLLSRAPGSAPAQDAVATETLDRQVVASQADLNKRTGHHYARANGLYYDPSTRAITLVPQGASLTLPDGYDVFDPAYLEYVTLPLDGAANPRGAGFDASARWLFNTFSVTYDAELGAKDITGTLDHETRGVPGIAEKVKNTSSVNLPPITLPKLNFPSFDFPPLTNTFLLPRATLNMATIIGNNSLFLTGDFDTPGWSSGSTWTGALANLGATGTIGTILSFTIDPYSPKYLGTGTAVNGWFCTTTRIYRITDIFGAFGLTLQHTFTDSVSAANLLRVMHASPIQQNWVMVASYNSSGGNAGVRIAYTTDGSTWTEVQITGHTRTGQATTPTLALSHWTPGVAFAFAYTATGSGAAATSTLHVTDDFGATWAVSAAPYPECTNDSHLGNCIVLPYVGNQNDSTLLWTKRVSGVEHLFKSVGATQTDIAPDNLGPGLNYGKNAIAVSPVDSNRILCCTRTGAETSFDGSVYASPDGGLTWTRIVDPVGSSRVFSAFIADDGQTIYLLGESVIRYSNDFGLTLDARDGNLGSGTRFVLIGG